MAESPPVAAFFVKPPASRRRQGRLRHKPAGRSRYRSLETAGPVFLQVGWNRERASSQTGTGFFASLDGRRRSGTATYYASDGRRKAKAISVERSRFDISPLCERRLSLNRGWRSVDLSYRPSDGASVRIVTEDGEEGLL